MKNIQIIDGAVNSVYEIYMVPDEDFSRLFPNDADIAFAEDFSENDPVWINLYKTEFQKKCFRHSWHVAFNGQVGKGYLL